MNYEPTVRNSILGRLPLVAVLGALVASLGGCATSTAANRSVRPAPPERPKGSPGGRFAEQVIESQPGLVECGSLACLREAFRDCRPTHYYESGYSAEGTPVYVDVFVLRQADRCWVVSYKDFTQDYWGGCAVTKRVCPSVEAALGSTPERDGCGTSEQLHKAEKCEDPYEGGAQAGQ